MQMSVSLIRSLVICSYRDQCSCSHTSQQNVVAEGKIQHIVETVRTLLIHLNVPKTFLGDAVLTAYFLINRLPSFVLAGKIPFFKLFPC